MFDNFNIDYDLLKDDFIVKRKGEEVARLAKISVMIAVNECLCNSGNAITLLEEGLPIAYIKREMIDEDSETKIIPIQIRDNKNLTDEELEDRLKVLAYDIIVAMTKEPTGEEITHYKKIIKLFVELMDIYKILENKKQIEKTKKSGIKFRGIETYWGKDKMFNPDEWTNEAFKTKE
mgnify:FL=1